MSIRRGVTLLVVAAFGFAVAGLLPYASRALSGGVESNGPVVLVPGMTGTKLRERETGKVVWGHGSNLVGRDGGYSLVRPVDPRLVKPPRLEAFEVIEEIRLAGLIRKKIYGPIVRLMEENGYQRGDLDDPRPEDTFFLFPYDWRQDNTLSAGLLHEKLEGLRRARGEERLRVALICQSSAAHICRYLLKYGGASLDEAGAGRIVPPSTIEVTKLILVGTSNGGSLRILREFNRGRNYLAIIGRKWEPETLFSFPALYQDLPCFRKDVFLDAAGETLDVDLYDAANWERYGWSIYGTKTQRRLAQNPRPELFGDAETRAGFLREMLAKTQRLQQLLRRDVEGFGSTQYYMIQGSHLETPERAVLVETDGEWETLFTGDRELKRNSELRALASAPGDGHASIESQMWLSPQEKGALAREPVYVQEGSHFEIILAPAAQEPLLEFLH